MDNAVSIISVKSVTGIRTEKEDGGKYSIVFIPNFGFSGASGKYEGDFYAKVTDLFGDAVGDVATVKFTDNAVEYKLEHIAGLSPNETYTLTVSGRNDFSANKSAALTTWEYDCVRAVFRRDALSILWSKPLIARGEIDVGGDWASAIPVPFGVKGYTLPLTGELYEAGHFTLRVAACLQNDEDTAVGPFCPPIDTYLAPPKITGAEIAGGTLRIECELPPYFTEHEGAFILPLGLGVHGEEPDYTRLLPPKAGTISDYDVSAFDTLDGLTAYLFVKSTAAIADGTPLFTNLNLGAANRLPLDHPTVWRKGFYAHKIGTETALLYAQQRADTESGKEGVTYKLPLYVEFSGGKSIEIEGLTLKKSGDGLALTVYPEKPLTAAKFADFLAKLSDETVIAKKISPGSYYKLRDSIARTAVFANADANYILHGIGAVLDGGEEAYRYQDIFPGYIFRVQTAGFRRQSDPEAEALQGYYQNAQADYPVAFNQAANRLEFDANQSLLVDHWDYLHTELTASVEEIYGGALDFSLSNLQLPYARVVSSGGFFPSGSLEDGLGPATGMSLLFAQEQSSLHAVTDLSNVSVPSLSFRGRAALGLCVTVFFAGAPVVVPSGTTLGSFALRYGAANLGKVKLRRRNYEGELVDVNAPLPVIASIPLLNGDMLV